MEVQMNHLALYERRPPSRNRDTSVRWVKEWVPQDLVSTGGKCLVLRWVREDVLKALKERCNEQEAEEPEPEPTTEVLFLCSFEGCGKTFIDAGALRKHAHIHGERQYVCHYEGCGKKFLDSSKLKRHFLIHTGQRDYVCPHEGCGKAFSLDFNLRAHMRTHTQENYHICPFEDCGKRYAHDYKLQAHIKSHHEKITAMNMRHTPPAEKLQNTPKTPASIYGSASSDRPHACPYEGCGKAYIHEYKLNLHLKREHPGHNPEENGKRASAPFIEHDMNETPEQDAYIGKDAVYKTYKKSKTTLVTKVPPSQVARKGQTLPSANPSFGKKQWPSKEMYDEEDSEETEEDREEDGWRYQETNEDDEETEDED